MHGDIMAHLLLTVLAVVCTAATVRADGAGDKPIEHVLFDRLLPDKGERIIVVRGPDIDVKLFDFWKGPDIEQIGKIYEIRVEIRAANRPTLVLATHLHRENKLTPLLNQEFAVMDALVEPGLIVLATTAGGNLSVWRIQVFGLSPTCWLQLGAGWNRYAAPMPLNDKVIDVKLGRAPDGRLTMEVVDKRGQLPHEHTLYEQARETDSRMERVRQWQEQPVVRIKGERIK